MHFHPGSFQHIIDAIPAYSALSTFEEMNARTSALRRSRCDGVFVRKVGQSQCGEPIDLISVGSGTRSFLFVGTPHPNEPVGCLTIEFMIDYLLSNPEFLQETGFTWHFVKSIEPDGLRLNEGWLKKPHDIAAYMANFFRPAADDQAEYAFPLSVGSYKFDRQMPENLAYQQAIQHAQPDILFSLHNAEIGGAFYFLTRDVGNLSATLSQHPRLLGIPLDEIGEPESQTQTFAPGVFQPREMSNPVTPPGADNVLASGDSAFGYCKPLGTLGMVAEIPYWKRSAQGRPNPHATLRQTFAPLMRLIQETTALLNRHQDIIALATTQTERRFGRAVQTFIDFLPKAMEFYGDVPDERFDLQAADVHRQAMSLVAMRPIAMMARLAKLLHARPGEHRSAALVANNDLSAFLDERLSEPAIVGDLDPVPLRTTVAVQIMAALNAAFELRQIP